MSWEVHMKIMISRSSVGAHIHRNSEGKLLCSYSDKLCSQRRLEGYAFCFKHILEDASSPFRRCQFYNEQSRKQCTIPIPLADKDIKFVIIMYTIVDIVMHIMHIIMHHRMSYIMHKYAHWRWYYHNGQPTNSPLTQQRRYCATHRQILGIDPKTSRKRPPQPRKRPSSSKSKKHEVTTLLLIYLWDSLSALSALFSSSPLLSLFFPFSLLLFFSLRLFFSSLYGHLPLFGSDWCISVLTRAK